MLSTSASDELYIVLEKKEKSSIDGRLFTIVKCNVILASNEICNQEMPLSGIKMHLFHIHGIDILKHKPKTESIESNDPNGEIWVSYLVSDKEVLMFRLFKNEKKASDFKQVASDVLMGFQHAYTDYMSSYSENDKMNLDQKMFELASLGLRNILPNKKYELFVSGGYPVF